MTTLVAVSKTTAVKTQMRIVGCEACKEEAIFPIGLVLDAVTGFNGAETDYILPERLRCPRCLAELEEDARVEWK